MKNQSNDRERILINICSMLAQELRSLHRLPYVKEYAKNPNNHCLIQPEGDYSGDVKFKKGDLVLCQTSVGRGNNDFVMSFVESPINFHRMLLRAIGTNRTCNYENESFVKFTGFPEWMLWEGDKQKFAEKLHKVLAKLDTYIHRFRFVSFPEDGKANVTFSQIFNGALGGETKPYVINIAYSKKTTLKEIKKALIDGGFGTRKFEPVEISA